MTTEYRVPIKDKWEWQSSVIDKDLISPPISPAKGDRYLIIGIGLGLWTGQDGNIAEYSGLSWFFTPKFEGMVVYVKDEGSWYCYTDSWQFFEYPKEYYNESLGETSTTSSYSTYINKLILNVIPKAGNYILFWNFKISASTAGYDVWCKVWNGTNIYSESRVNCSIIRNNVGWEERSGFIKLTLTPVNINFYIDFCRNAAGTAYIKDAKLLLRRTN
jgi:hypothetical protein